MLGRAQPICRLDEELFAYFDKNVVDVERKKKKSKYFFAERQICAFMYVVGIFFRIRAAKTSKNEVN